MPYDYTRVTAASLTADVDAGLAAADAALASLAGGPRTDASPPTYAGTLRALDRTVGDVQDLAGQTEFLGHVSPDAGIREAGLAAQERIGKWFAGLAFRPEVAAAVEAFAATGAAAALDGEERLLLEHWQRDLRRAGRGLDPEAQAELRTLQDRLVEISTAFQRNLAAWSDGIDVTREQLAGLSEEYVARLGPGTAPGTSRVTLDYPDVQPFLAQAQDRDCREALLRKFWTRAVDANRPLLEEALAVRRRAAVVAGYPTWADFALEERMAATADRVAAMYAELRPDLEAATARELATFRALEGLEDGDDLQVWDTNHADTLLRKTSYGVDQDALSQYFPLPAVFDGLLDLTAEAFGLAYDEVGEARAWHPDVRLFAVRDASSGELLAHFYLDLHPRPDKYEHAAAFPLVPGRSLSEDDQRSDSGTGDTGTSDTGTSDTGTGDSGTGDSGTGDSGTGGSGPGGSGPGDTAPGGGRRTAVSAMVANFTPPAGERPSLLRHSEVLTLFHEFGHILHMSLGTTRTARFSGASTETDFVEAPSQIMEHWAWDPDVLARFARHWSTGAAVPAELTAQLAAARWAGVGWQTARQVFLGSVDLELHAATEAPDLDAVLRETHRVTGLPYPEGTFFLAGFGHLLGGYDAGYYGYLWAQIIGDDLFSRFAAEGLLSPAVGGAYRRAVLERGGSRPAEQLVRDFLGRDATSEAYRRLRGLPVAGAAGAAAVEG